MMICYGFYKGYQHHTGTPAGAVNFEKPHHIIALQFSEVSILKDKFLSKNHIIT